MVEVKVRLCSACAPSNHAMLGTYAVRSDVAPIGHCYNINGLFLKLKWCFPLYKSILFGDIFQAVIFGYL
jgi:hypothetical protein